MTQRSEPHGNSAVARVRRGALANGLAMTTRFGVQLLTLPVLFATFGAETVGLWLMLATVPTYVALTATGFGGAAGNAMIAAGERGNVAEAQANFWACWIIVALVSLSTSLIVALLSGRIAHSSLLESSTVSNAEIQITILGLCAYVIVSLQGSVAEQAFRFSRRYPTAIAIGAAHMWAELLAIAAAAVMFRSIAALPVAMAIVSMASMATAMVIARKQSPEIFRIPPVATICRAVNTLWKPSLAFMAPPLVFAVNLQGYSLLIGAVFGPIALAGFAATRTLCRLLDQLSNSVFTMQFLELPYWQSGAAESRRRIVATSTVIMVMTAIIFSGSILIAGQTLQRIWTLGQTSFDAVIAFVLCLAAANRAASAAPSAMLASVNRHSAMTAIYLLSSVAAFSMASVSAYAGAPLWGVAMWLVVAESTLLVTAFAACLRMLDYPTRDLLRDLVSFRARLHDTGSMVGGLRQNKSS